MRIGDHHFELPVHFSVKSPVRKAFLSAIQTDLSGTSLFYAALCVDVIVAGVVGITIKIIGIHIELKGLIPVKITECYTSEEQINP